MTLHTIRAEVEVKFTPIGCTEPEYAYPTLDIEFSYTPGYAATGPSYDSGGEPGAGAEVEFLHATLVNDDGITTTAALIDQWGEDYLASNHGYEAACDQACDEGGPDPDEAYERMRDDRDTREDW